MIENNLDFIAKELNEERNAIIPTETVYGLAGLATSNVAVENIYKLKKRPSWNPLILHGRNKDSFEKYVKWNKLAEKLANEFWPGSLTIVLPLIDSNISKYVHGVEDTIAIRVPNNGKTIELLGKVNGLLAAPSANPFMSISPTNAEMSCGYFPQIPVLDGGNCTIGVESTIVNLASQEPEILRYGGVCEEKINDILEINIKKSLNKKTIAPGACKKHYSPKKPLKINVTKPNSDEFFVTFGNIETHGNKNISLSVSGDLNEAAANLFFTLDKCDKCLDTNSISISPIPNEGIGLAINDRIKRASS